MKTKYCFLALGCVGSLVAANAATITLPSSTQVPQTAQMGTTGVQLLDKVKGSAYGIYAGGNNNSISNWPQNGEGTWINNSNIGSMTLCGRSGVAGDSFAMVLSGPQQGDVVTSFTFSCNSPTSIITSYTMVLGVYDATGTLVQNLSTTQDFSFGATTTPTSISLDMSSSPLVWGAGYKLVAGIKGGAGTATSAYTITNLQVSYDTQAVPEPATATLGLLGLSALVMRRRRK